MCDDTPRCVIEAAHARWVEEARQIVQRVAGLDPDGPLVPMRPREHWDGTRRLREGAAHFARADRDAALIAAIAKLWG